MIPPELHKMCELLYATYSMPIAVLCGEESALFCTYRPFGAVFRTVAAQADERAVALLHGRAGLYGAIRAPQENALILVGPYTDRAFDAPLLRAIVRDHRLGEAELMPLRDFLTALPTPSLNSFLNLLALVHYLVNGEELDPTEYFRRAEPDLQTALGQRRSDALLHAAQTPSFAHGTYDVERRILAYIAAGDTEGLKRFCEHILRMRPMREGVLADDPLRQAKNIFVGLITMAGKDGAIPGGLDVEETYRLIDLYIRECERCISVSRVAQLRYTALFDFARRVQACRRPQPYAEEVQRALQYIRAHTDAPISVADIVAHVGRSRSAFLTQFKRETGETIGACITKAKLEEAKMLLAYSGSSLAAIAHLLCFSSQSYFQNLFKRTFGITPLAYRRQCRAQTAKSP